MVVSSSSSTSLLIFRSVSSEEFVRLVLVRGITAGAEVVGCSGGDGGGGIVDSSLRLLVADTGMTRTVSLNCTRDGRRCSSLSSKINEVSNGVSRNDVSVGAGGQLDTRVVVSLVAVGRVFTMVDSLVDSKAAFVFVGQSWFVNEPDILLIDECVLISSPLKRDVRSESSSSC